MSLYLTGNNQLNIDANIKYPEIKWKGRKEEKESERRKYLLRDASKDRLRVEKININKEIKINKKLIFNG